MAYDSAASALEEKIRETVPSASVKETEKLFEIFLHLDPDEQFTKTAPEIVEKIYLSLDFPSLCASRLVFHLIDETELETAVIRFVKDSKQTEDLYLKNMDIYATGRFAGGRMDPLKDALLDRIAETPFYQGLTREAHPWETK